MSVGKFMRRYGVEVWAALAGIFFLAAATTMGVSLTFEHEILATWGLLGLSFIFAGLAIQAQVVRKETVR